MSWTKAQASVTATSSSQVSSQAITLGSSVTAGNLIVIYINNVVTALNSAATFTVTDNKTGNTYTLAKAGSYIAASAYRMTQAVYYSVVSAGGGSFTVTVTPSYNAYIMLAIEEWSFTSGATVTAESTNYASGVGTAVSSGNLILTGSDLVVSVTDDYNSQSVTAGTGFVLVGTFGTIETAVENYANVSTSPLPATFSFGGSGAWGCVGVAFKATVAVPNPPASPYLVFPPMYFPSMIEE